MLNKYNKELLSIRMWRYGCEPQAGVALTKEGSLLYGFNENTWIGVKPGRHYNFFSNSRLTYLINFDIPVN